MCEFRSYIITKTDVLSLRMSNSHEDIIEHYKLKDAELVPRKFVRVEMHYAQPVDTVEARENALNWNLAIDDMDYAYIPSWFDRFEAEDRAREILAKDLQEPHHWYVATNTLPPAGIHSALFYYVLRHITTISQRVTPAMEPVDERRLAYARRYPRSLLDSTPPPTAAEEPCVDVRDVWSARSSYVRLKPPTVMEEPQEHVRRAACIRGEFVPTVYMPTFEEEPSLYNRVVYLMRQKMQLTQPTPEQTASVGIPAEMHDYLVDSFFSSNYPETNWVGQKLTWYYDMLQSANESLGIQPMPADYRRGLPANY